jgi:hypothetical protein
MNLEKWNNGTMEQWNNGIMELKAIFCGPNP